MGPFEIPTALSHLTSVCGLACDNEAWILPQANAFAILFQFGGFSGLSWRGGQC